ncbi:YCF48-related protein [Candidatus Neomarinimicrobiota bacterium]
MKQLLHIGLLLLSATILLQGRIGEVFFINDSTGYVVGFGPYLLNTVDRGLSWTDVYIAEGSFNTVQFTDPQTGYVGGQSGRDAVIYQTQNGGTTWTTVYTLAGDDFVTHGISDIHFSDDTTGHAIIQRIWQSSHDPYYCGILKTIDNGETWIQATDDFTLRGHYEALTFISSGTGFLVGTIDASVGVSPIILKTTDRGDTWESVYESGGTPGLLSLFFTNPDTGYAVGVNGRALKTTSGGPEWIDLTTSVNVDLNAISMINGSTGCAVGKDGMIIRTTDGGSTWVEEESGTTSDLLAVTFTSDSIGIALGDGIILRSADAGETWAPADFPPLTVPEKSDVILPSRYALHQNHPNPFNPATTLRYDLPEAAMVRLIVYDLLGREVTTLVDAYTQPGNHETIWNAANLPSGIYIARLKTPGYGKSIKMVLLK